MTGAAVALRAAEVRAGGRVVLGPLDLDLAPGEYRCVLGRSGSGKTTLLRLVAGLAAPSRGEVLLDGRPVSRGARVLVRPERRGVGMLFQEGALWPHMSVARTLAFALGCAGVPRRERAARAGELLAAVHLEGFEARLPAGLSGGEAQRLALARALAASPRVLLLDEPLGPLDEELRGELVGALRELHRRLGFTALHVTHDRREPELLGAGSLELSGGRWTEPAP